MLATINAEIIAKLDSTPKNKYLTKKQTNIAIVIGFKLSLKYHDILSPIKILLNMLLF